MDKEHIKYYVNFSCYLVFTTLMSFIDRHTLMPSIAKYIQLQQGGDYGTWKSYDHGTTSSTTHTPKWTRH
jgi:hypothetical protein